MDRLEQLFIGLTAILLIVSLAYMVAIVIIRRRATAEGLVDEAELDDVEFPQVLKPGLPEDFQPPSFDALGLHSDATPDDVLAAYRRLALEVHPDHGGDAAAFTQLQHDFELAMAHAEGRLAHAR